MNLRRIILPILLFGLPATPQVLALGNHPTASACGEDNPYFAICSHSLHSLEGWNGDCRNSRELAQKDADEHAEKHHKGNSRYTGIKKARTGSNGTY